MNSLPIARAEVIGRNDHGAANLGDLGLAGPRPAEADVAADVTAVEFIDRHSSAGAGGRAFTRMSAAIAGPARSAAIATELRRRFVMGVPVQ